MALTRLEEPKLYEQGAKDFLRLYRRPPRNYAQVMTTTTTLNAVPEKRSFDREALEIVIEQVFKESFERELTRLEPCMRAAMTREFRSSLDKNLIIMNVGA
jgi:hypothetical protein